MVLLGAGASVEAGLPTANDLTDIVKSHFQNSENRNAAKIFAVLQYVTYGLLFEESKKASQNNNRTLSRQIPENITLDVERLLNAVSTIARKQELDLDAFITSWDPSLNALDYPRNVPGGNPFGMHDISSLLKDTSHSSSNRTMSPRSSMNIQRALEGAIDSVLSKRLTPEAFSTRSTSTGIFSEAVDASVVSLKSILKTTKSLDYLSPIKVLATEQQPLTVATLNYDNVIETFCAANGLAVSNGLATWSKRFEVNKPHNTNLFLIKLHG